MVNRSLLLLNLCLGLCACNQDVGVVYHRYRLETIDDAYVCVDNQTYGICNERGEECIEDDSLEPVKVMM